MPDTEKLSEIENKSPIMTEDPDMDNSLACLEPSEMTLNSDLLLSSPILPDLTDDMLPTSVDIELEQLSEIIYAHMKKECERPCWVVLEKLSAKEVEKYTPILYEDDWQLHEEEWESKRNLRNFQKLSKFEKYSLKRKQFLNKKRRQSSDADRYESSNDEYQPSDSYGSSSKDRKKKKKKHSYEDDVEWSPNLDRNLNLTWKYTSSKHRKSDKLRITTRRRRIETDSDSDSDFDYETYMYDYEEDQENLDNSEGSKATYNDIASKDIYDTASTSKPPPKQVKKKKPKVSEMESADNSQSTMIDNDVLSRIMQEMEDYNMKNRKGSKVVRSIFNGETINQNSTSSFGVQRNQPKQKRRGIKVTSDVLPPSVCTVKKLLSNMVNTVCSIENTRLKEVKDSNKKKCKWCETLFNSKNSKEILCVICRDLINATPVKDLLSKKKVKKLGTSGVGGAAGKVSKPKKKIMSKVLKNLPKYDQHRLMYGDKADRTAVDKGYNHLKSFSSSKEPENNESSFIDPGDALMASGMSKNIKNKGKNIKNVKAIDTKGQSCTSDSNVNVKNATKNVAPPNISSQSSAQPILNNIQVQNGMKNQKHVSVTNVNKGLFLMTFPDPDKELEIPLGSPNLRPILPADNSISLTTVPTTLSPLNSITIGNNSATVSVASAKDTLGTTLTSIVPSATSKQYGKYLLPKVPTVVVANYSASETKSGDFVLSGVYYQNEITQGSATNKGKTSGTTPANKPLNMPTINQLTMNTSSVPTNTYQSTLVSLPNISIRPSIDENSNVSRIPFNVPTATRNIQTPISMPSNNIIISNVTSQVSAVPQPFQVPLYVPNNAAVNNHSLPINTSYPVDSDINRLLNRGSIQISSTTANTYNVRNNTIGLNNWPSNANYPAEPNIDNLVSNCNLQIMPVSVGNSEFRNQANVATESSAVLNGTKYSNEPDITGLINNCGLPILSAQSESSHLPSELFENTDTSNSVPGMVEAIKDHQKEGKTSFAVEKQTTLQKEYNELSALAMLGIIDLEKNPKASLHLRIEENNKLIEELSKDKSKIEEYQAALNSKEIYKIAKKLFVRFGSFTRLSEYFLKVEEITPLKTPLQIKKEHIEEEEEEMASCQFTDNPSRVNEQFTGSDISTSMKVKLEGLMMEKNSCELASSDLNHIERIQTQIEAITDQLISSGVDCTLPIPGITAMSSNTSALLPNAPRNDLLHESRETPSRGSGPITPTRPESAASHTEERILTPAQVKRERIESSGSPFSQCAYSTNNPTTSQPSMPANISQVILPPNVSQSVRTVSPLVSMSQILTQSTMPQQLSVIQPNISQTVGSSGVAFRSSPVTSRLSSAPNVSLIPNVTYTNAISNSSNVSIRTLPQNISGTNVSNFLNSRYGTNLPSVTLSNHYNNTSVNYQIQNSVNYQNQVPPNRTAPFNANQNASKVLMDLISKQPTQNINSNAISGNPNAGVIFRNEQQAGQLYMQQQQQQSQQQSVGQIYNVQQVYLPNRTPILQQSLSSSSAAPTPPTNQYIVRQTPSTVSSSLVGGTVLVNNASVAGNSIQQNNLYSLQNSVASNYPHDQVAQSLNTAAIQQISSPGNQIPTGTFLVQNNDKLSSTVAEKLVTEMYCAMCNKVATLRCKQCAKVAYCNPTCAKTYWHAKHKMECKPIDGPV